MPTSVIYFARTQIARCCVCAPTLVLRIIARLHRHVAQGAAEPLLAWVAKYQVA